MVTITGKQLSGDSFLLTQQLSVKLASLFIYLERQFWLGQGSATLSCGQLQGSLILPIIIH